jgi:alpha-glucoside transport system substrate-binding protein
MGIRRRIPARVLAVLSLIAACTTACAGFSTTTLTILTPWDGNPEQAAFQAVVDAFRASDLGRGIHVDVKSTRSAATVLQADVQQRAVPDLAVMTSPGEVRAYASEHVLTPLDDLVDKSRQHSLDSTLHSDYGPQWQGLLEAGTGHLQAVPIKVSVKSLIWYDPRNLNIPVARDWAHVASASSSLARQGTTPWCLALADPPSSGWPGTDWVEDILLHQSGADFYQRWAQGGESWTLPEVRSAWQTWGSVVTAPGRMHGTVGGVLSNGFDTLDNPMFAKPPGCVFSHGALISTKPDPKPKPVPGEDYDIFEFPAIEGPGANTDEVSGNLMGIFHDSPAADRFMAFLAGPQAQEIWPEQKGQADVAFTANDQAELALTHGVYARDEIADHINRLLADKHATLCFDASDVMLPVMQNAFYRAVLEYLEQPSQLVPILNKLETIRKSVYPPNGPTDLRYTCGSGS